MAFSGKGRCPSYLQSAVTLAREQYGATLFAAAGNDVSFASENFPANCEGRVTSVGALDEMYKVAPYSALGTRLYLPGSGVPCAYPLDARVAEHVPGCIGTSVSTAVAAGLQSCGFFEGVMQRLLTDGTALNESSGNGTDVFARDFGYYTGRETCFTGMYVCNTYYCCDCQPNNYCYMSNPVTAPYQAPCPGKAKSIVAAAWSSEKQDWISGLTYAKALDSPMGRTSRVKSRYCILCEAGYYFDISYSTDVNMEACFPCPANTYCPGDNTLYACAAGLTSPYRSTSSTQCVQCTSGTFWNGVSCVSCLPGYYWNSALRVCSQFQVGTYGSGKDTTCLACDTRKIASATGQANCTACAAGYYAVSTSSCLPCDPGKYWPGGVNGTVACLQCLLGYIPGTGASSCTSCGQGTYSGSSQTSCTDCDAGKYSAGTANAACTNCFAGTFSATTRATNASVCKACTSSGYSASNGATACSNCAPNFPISSTAHTGEIDYQTA